MDLREFEVSPGYIVRPCLKNKVLERKKQQNPLKTQTEKNKQTKAPRGGDVCFNSSTGEAENGKADPWGLLISRSQY